MKPERHQMLIDLKPYFDYQENLISYDDEDLEVMWSEMMFIRHHIDGVLEIQF